MIIVTGTKRSGTSMWMQILRDGGIPVIGEAFPKQWEHTIRDANPHGFYESALRRGINFTTNPNPRTGEYLSPAATRHHAVKVFAPGLARSDLAYIDRVVVTMRPWREYVHSLERLYSMEHANMEARSGHERQRSVRVPAMLEWWDENYTLIRDVVIRRYPANFVSYDMALREPERVIREVFRWLGTGDADAAVAAVKPETRTQRTPERDPTEPEYTLLFDELYELVDRSQPLTAPFIERLNAVAAELGPAVAEARAMARADALRRRKVRQQAVATAQPVHASENE